MPACPSVELAVEFGDHAADHLHVGNGGEHHQAVGARVGDDLARLRLRLPAASLRGSGTAPAGGRCSLPLGDELVDQRGEFLGIGVFQGDDFQQIETVADIERLDDFHQSFNIGGRIGENQGIGWRIGDDAARFRHQRRNRRGDCRRIDVLQSDQAGDVLFSRKRIPFEQGGQVAFLGIPRRNDFACLPCGDDRESLETKNGEKQIIGLIETHRIGRNNGRFPFDGIVVNEIPAGQFAHGLNQIGQLDLLEIEGNLAPLFHRRFGGRFGNRFRRGRGFLGKGCPGTAEAQGDQEQTCAGK